MLITPSSNSAALLEQVRQRLQRTLETNVTLVPAGAAPAGADTQRWRIEPRVQLLARAPGAAALTVLSAAASPEWLLVEVHPYVSPSLGEQLRAQGICYADALGNAWVKHPALLVFVQGCQLKAATMPSVLVLRVNHMRLLFQLLLEPAIATYSMVDLSTFTGLPRAIITPVVEKLVAGGLWLDGSAASLSKIPELTAFWVNHYGTKLRNRLNPQRYRWARPLSQGAWKRLSWPAECWWSGEAAAHHLLGKPEEPRSFTLYSSLPRPKLVQELGLVPAQNGPVELLNAFLPATFAAPADPRCATPLLVYADLVARESLGCATLANELRTHYLPLLEEPPTGMPEGAEDFVVAHASLR